MDYRKGKNGIVIRLDENDEIIASVIDVCKKENIKSAMLHGIGAGKKFAISHFDTLEMHYHTRTFEGVLEIVTLSGNISLIGEEPSAHIHVVLGKEDFTSVGGHLVEGIANPTCEITIIPLDIKVERVKDERTGLNLQKF
jgi:predicted DNA-binding protein with PD1-like motif